MPRFKDVFKLFVFAVLILLGTLTLFSCDINKSDSNDITVGIKISDDTVFRFGKDVNVIIPSTKDDVKITKIDVRDGVDFNNGDYPAKTNAMQRRIVIVNNIFVNFIFILSSLCVLISYCINYILQPNICQGVEYGFTGDALRTNNKRAGKPALYFLILRFLFAIG